jgi:hypothetical protein
MKRQTTESFAPDATNLLLVQPSWGRPVAIVTAGAFFVSSLFPVVAGLSKNTKSFPQWWGRVDVGLAFLLVGLALAVVASGQGRENQQVLETSYHAYRFLNHAILGMLVAFFLAGDRIVWAHCLTGFAWRAWLLIYALPAWFAAMRSNAVGPSPYLTNHKG